MVINLGRDPASVVYSIFHTLFVVNFVKPNIWCVLLCLCHLCVCERARWSRFFLSPFTKSAVCFVRIQFNSFHISTHAGSNVEQESLLARHTKRIGSCERAFELLSPILSLCLYSPDSFSLYVAISQVRKVFQKAFHIRYAPAITIHLLQHHILWCNNNNNGLLTEHHASL